MEQLHTAGVNAPHIHSRPCPNCIDCVCQGINMYLLSERCSDTPCQNPSLAPLAHLLPLVPVCLTNTCFWHLRLALHRYGYVLLWLRGILETAYAQLPLASQFIEVSIWVSVALQHGGKFIEPRRGRRSSGTILRGTALEANEGGMGRPSSLAFQLGVLGRGVEGAGQYTGHLKHAWHLAQQVTDA